MAEENLELQSAVLHQVRSQLWYQIEKAATNAECIELYTDKVRKVNRIFDIIISSVPILGLIGSFFELYWALVAIILSIIGSLIKYIIPNLRQSNSELLELDKLGNFYETYLVDCVNIYTRLYAKQISPIEAQAELYPIERKSAEKTNILNRLIWKLKGLHEDIEINVTDSLNRRFGINPPSE